MRDAEYRRPRSARGFTLIEVIAALVIVALGMLGVIEAVSQTASNGTYLRDKTLAHWVALNKLAAVRLELQPPKVDETSDEVEMTGRRWRWTMKVTQTPVDSIRRIDIRVRPAEANKDSSLASVTGFYGTAITAAGTGVPVSWTVKDTQGGGAPGTAAPGDEGTRPDPQRPGSPPPPPVPEPGGEPVDAPLPTPEPAQ